MAKDLILKLLQKKPQDRIGANDIQQLKDHPFFEGINWMTLQSTDPPYQP